MRGAGNVPMRSTVKGLISRRRGGIASVHDVSVSITAVGFGHRTEVADLRDRPVDMTAELGRAHSGQRPSGTVASRVQPGEIDLVRLASFCRRRRRSRQPGGRRGCRRAHLDFHGQDRRDAPIPWRCRSLRRLSERCGGCTGSSNTNSRDETGPPQSSAPLRRPTASLPSRIVSSCSRYDDVIDLMWP